MGYKILLKIISNRLIWPTDGILTGTSTGQSGPGSNGNEGRILHSQTVQNWNLTIRCSSVSYLGD